MASPSMTFNAAGNLRPAAALAASALWYTYVDYSGKIEGQVTIKNTPGGSISAARGLRVEFYSRYGATADTSIPTFSYDLPSAAASTAESKTFFLGTGKWVIAVRNQDAAYAVTLEVTDATVDSIG